MARLLAKICGITRPQDALTAAQFGADFIGYIVVPSSKRRAEPDQIHTAVQAVRAARPGVLHVLVTLDGTPEDSIRMARQTGVDAIQLHGNEPPATAQAIQRAGFLVIKAVPVGVGAPEHDWTHYPCDYRLLDTYHDGASGGTGRLMDLSLIPPASERGPEPLLLAGGLKPDNVASVLQEFRPEGVDVSSGVELSPGIKDPEKVRLFLESVAQA